MFGWRSIGLAISVLWLVGFPTALMMDANQRAAGPYASCVKATDGTSTLTGDLARAQELLCRVASNASAIQSATLVQLLITGKEAWLLWTMMLAPIAALWIVGGITITTVRSIVSAAGRSVGFHKI